MSDIPDGFKMTEIGMMPDEWETAILESVVNVKGGKRLPKGRSLSDEVTPYPYIRVVDFTNYSVDILKMKHLVPEDHKAIERYIITSEDVYISIAGSIGIVGTVPQELNGANLTENAARLIIADKERLDKSYLVSYLASDRGKMEINLRTTKTSQPKLALTRIKQIPIPLPPLPEQKQIAAVLSTVQDAKEKTEAVIQAARELKKSLMKHLFTYGPVSPTDAADVPLRETEIGMVPEEWEVALFGEVVEIVSGQITPTEEPYKSMYYVGPENIEEASGRLLPCKTIRDLGLTSGKYLFSTEHVLYSKIRPYLRKAALPTFIGLCSADMYPLKSVDGKFLREFLVYVLLTEQFTAQAISFQTRTGIPKINRNQLGMIPLPVPPLPIQQQIADILSAVDQKIEAEMSKKQALDELFKTLLSNLMTGRIRVNNLEML